MYTERLKKFIELCYDNKPYRVAKLSKINLMTLKKWIDGGDIKLSSIQKLSNAGINISWLVSGMGTMFAHNDIGKELKENNEIKEKIKQHFKHTYDREEMKKKYESLIKESIKIEDEKERENYVFKELPNWYKFINDKSTNTMTNYFLIVWPELFESQQDKALLTYEDDDSENNSEEEIKEIFPIIFAFALDYLGTDIHTILENIMPNYLEEYLLESHSDILKNKKKKMK